MIELPIAFREEMKELLGEEYPAYLAAYERPVRQGFRLNSRKLTKEKWESINPFGGERVPWTQNGYYIENEWGKEKGVSPSRHPYYYAGLYYIQEPSAMTPASRLPIEPGERVLDLCAAPGGKATELGSRLLGKGFLVANDISGSRAKALLKNLEMTGLTNYYVTSEDPEKLKGKFPEYFHKVLIDAPCSGEGMFHKEPQMAGYWEERPPAYYAQIQKKLILQGADMLRPGGMLLYSTCTFSKQENEEVIAFLLKERPDMETLQPLPYKDFAPGFALERETEDLCEQLCVYDDAMAITLFNSLRSGRYTYDEFYVFRDWCREKLAWYRYQERIHPENDYRLDYRYRPDPFTIRAFGKVMVDMHKPNLDIQPKKYDRDGKRIYTFDRGHDITDEEMDIFLMRAEMQRDVIIRDGLAKKSYDYAVQLLDEENYNPFDPVSVRIHDIKVKQRQQKDQYKFYKRAYRNLMSESQFDNWWFGYDNNPKVQLTPLQQRIRYVDRMTEMNMEMLRTNLVPVDYVARAKAYNDAIEKSFREFDEGYIKKEDSLADCFDKLSYLMVRVNDLELEEQRKNRMINNRMNDYSGYRSTLGSFDKRNSMDQFLYNQYGQGYTQYSTTGYKIDQKPIEFTNSANYLNQSSKFKDYCHMNKGNRQLNPIAN